MSSQFSIPLRLNTYSANVFTASWLLLHPYIINDWSLVYWETFFLLFFLTSDPKCCLESVIMFCCKGKNLKLCSKRRKFRAGQWECFYLACYNSGSSCAWKCNASSVIIMPVGGLIRTADSQAMQQQALDILNGPDIIALTFHFLYILSQKMKWWMGFLDG